MLMAAKDVKKTKKERFKWVGQIRQTYQIAKAEHPRIGLLLSAIFFGVLILGVLIAIVLPISTYVRVLIIVVSLSVAFLATSFVFGRKAESAAYASIANQTGAAAAVLTSMKGGWFTTPAVAVTKNEDLVHLVVGRPGVIIVGEGAPSRVKHLMGNTRRKYERWVPETPFTELIVGDGEGEVPLPKLQTTLKKMPKVLRPAEVTELRRRLEAATKANSPVPVPKGPLPKNARVPRPPKM